MVVRNLNRRVWGIVAAGVGLCVSQGYAGEYEVVDLEGGVSYDINIHGEAVVEGYRDRAGFLQWWAFLWKGALADVDVSDDYGVVARISASAINDFGDVVGNHSFGSDSAQYEFRIPFVQHHETGYMPLVLEDSAADGFARDINDKQQVVGNYRINNDEPWQAYLWQADGQGAPLNGVAGEPTIATALNNADPVQVVGARQTVEGSTHAFVWTEGGALRDLGEFQEYHTVATGINDSGHVVGWFGSGFRSIELRSKYIRPVSESSSRAFLWSEGQGEDPWTDLGTLATDNAGQSAAYGINNDGQVVGYAETDSGEVHAFLYTLEEGMQDLNTLIPADSGWVLEVAHGVNQYGQIVGQGLLKGIPRAFLLTPSDMSLPVDIVLRHRYEPQYPRVDEPLTLVTTIVNSGTAPATVRVVHTLAAELKVLSAPDNCTQDGQQLECDMGELLAGESHAITMNLQSSFWGRWAVASTAEAIPQGLPNRLARETTFIPVSRKEPEIASAYHIVDLGTDVTTEDDRGPLINNWGEVALGGREGVIYSGGVVKFVDSSATNFYDLNDDGWFVGSRGSSISTPVVWDQDNGKWLPLNGVIEDGGSKAFGINSLGQVVGTAVRDAQEPEAFIASIDDDVQWLGALNGGVSWARDINDDSWVIGSSSLETGEVRFCIGALVKR